MNGLNDLSELEIDLLLLFYLFSDQYGKVDMPAVIFTAATKLGVSVPNHQFYIRQKHIDALMDHGVLADTRDIITKMKSQPTKKPRQKKT